MSTTHLATKHRPQTFAQVAGQEIVKAALSRASATDAIAPAYLFSGTRGVGKTTCARILAKAVNCETAPTAEPCNVCRFCKAITAGSLVDVVEIDAASNRGIDDARRLKEDIGYAPLEARYKVFIIDEAHMLTREAFNALLKTLEEPPGHATFVLATTEPHKFPATILSRCQQYTFRALSQADLEVHLRTVLDAEGAPFEDEAVRLMARRGAGSVRDSMSLAGQALALGGETLTAADVRSILGLAGQEVYHALMEGFEAQDCLAVAGVLEELLAQGLDLGFFLRELAQVWRNLFLLKQGGEKALALTELPQDEARAWLGWADRLPLARIHASWQLTLEGQQRVQRSLEPALALELLLFNLASLPQLLPLEDAGGPPRSSGQSGAGSAMGGRSTSGMGGRSTSGGGGQSQASTRPPAPPRPQGEPEVAPEPIPPEMAAPPSPPPEDIPGPPAAMRDEAPVAPVRQEETPAAENPPAVPVPGGERTWDGFVAYATERAQAEDATLPALRGISGDLKGSVLEVACINQYQCSLLGKGVPLLEAYAQSYFGPDTEVRLSAASEAPRQSRAELREEVKAHPAVQEVMRRFDASILAVRPK